MSAKEHFNYNDAGEDPVVQEWLESQMDKPEMAKLGLQDYTAMQARGFEFGVTGSGRKAFHGDTEVHKGLLYVEDVLHKYGFDDPVEKVPMYVPRLGAEVQEVEDYDEAGESAEPFRYNLPRCQEVPSAYATVRTRDNKILGTVGERYEVIQTPAAFAFLNTLVEAERLIVEAAVSLRGGAIIALTVRKPENITIAGDEFVPYLNAINGFDGQTPIQVLASPVRIVCLNTQRLSLQHATSSYRVRHTAGALQKLQEAREALEISFRPSELDAEFADLTGEFRQEAEAALSVATRYEARLSEEANKLALISMNNIGFEKFLRKLVPIDDETPKKAITMRENKREAIRTVWLEEDNLSHQRNAWGALQSVVQFTDHVKSYRSRDTKVMTILSGADDNQLAYSILSES